MEHLRIQCNAEPTDMSKQTYLVEIEDAPETKWKGDEAGQIRIYERMIEQAIIDLTTGPVPKVTISNAAPLDCIGSLYRCSK